MSNNDWGVELLADDPNRGALKTDSAGKAYRQANYDGPSLSGPMPSFGAGAGQGAKKGLGGTEVGVERDPEAHRAMAAAGQTPTTRQYTPDEMMALASRLEQDFMQKAKQAEQPHQSAVEPTLSGSNRYGGSVTPNAPDWLVQYMEGQQPMGEFQMGGPVDKVKGKQYLAQQEMLKHLKSQQ